MFSQSSNVYAELTSALTTHENYQQFANYYVAPSEDFSIEYQYSDQDSTSYFGAAMQDEELSWVSNGRERLQPLSISTVNDAKYGPIGSQINNSSTEYTELTNLASLTPEINAASEDNFQMWSGPNDYASFVREIVNSGSVSSDNNIPEVQITYEVPKTQNQTVQYEVSSNTNPNEVVTTNVTTTNITTSKVGAPVKNASNGLFPCSSCPYVAKKKLYLQLHITNKHTEPENVTWYLCDKCTYKCKRKDKLKVHGINMHTPPDEIIWFECVMCEYKHKNKDEINRHMKKKHNYVPPKEQRISKTPAKNSRKTTTKPRQTPGLAVQFSNSAAISPNFTEQLEDISSILVTQGPQFADSVTEQCFEVSTIFGDQIVESGNLVTDYNLRDPIITPPFSANEYLSAPSLLNEQPTVELSQSGELQFMEAVQPNESLPSWNFGVHYIETDQQIVQSVAPSSDTYSVQAVPEIYNNLILADSVPSADSIPLQFVEFGEQTADAVLVGDQNDVQYSAEIREEERPPTVQSCDTNPVQSVALKSAPVAQSVEFNNFINNSLNKQTGRYECPLCLSFNSKYRDKYASHLNITHAPPEAVVWFECNVCAFKTKFKDNVRQHKISIHASRSTVQRFNCGLCKYKTRSSKLFELHEKKHGASKPRKWLKCDACTYKTCFRTTLKKHVAARHSKLHETFQCDRCDFKTKTANYLKLHVNRRHVVREVAARRFACSYCQLKFRRNDNLKSHVKQIHSERLEWFRCTLCPLKTAYKAALKSHLAVVHSDKIVWLKCGSCSFRSKYRATLDRHSAVHDKKVEIFKCDCCAYETNRKWSLTRHVNTQHLQPSVEGFECEVCDFKTKQKANLKVHVKKRHGEERPQRLWFRCAVCSYKTLTKKLHERHVEEKHPNCRKFRQFQCKQCGFKAKTEVGLKAHVRRIH